MNNIQKAIETANARGIGQFHVFEKEGGTWVYGTTWHSFITACAVAQHGNGKGRVYNDSGKLVYTSYGK